MAVTCSLQLSCKPGIYKNSNCNQFKRLDDLSFQLLNGVHRPIHSVPSRYNVFVCRSLLVPAGTTDVLRTAANAFTRSCNKGSPLVLQLVPALGVIVFAVWGIAPLVRYSRKLFLRESDNNWRSSHAHHVTTSYLQPLLMWTGMTLIYRVVDPVVLTSQTSQGVKQRLLVFLRSLSNVLGIAYCVSSLIQQAQKVFMEKNDPRDMKYIAFQLAWNGVYSAVWVAAASLFMELLGFPTQKWLTAGGLGTVFLTLAGRELVTDFLSSVMIHTTRPFVVNEWIQTRIEGYDVSGTVESVGWWGPTVIRGDDREAVHIPNHKFTVNVVRNLSQKTHWRIKTHLAISHLDVNKINIIVADMRKVLSKNPQVEQQKLHRRVFLESINPENQALMILISCFVKTSRFEEYLCVKEAITLDLLRIISHHRARLATPIRTYQQSHSDADMENIPFSENMYSRARATNNRRLLLIDPAYKVNSDKAKAQSGSLRTNEEQDNKITTTVASIPKADEAIATKFDSKSDTQVAEIAVEADYKVIETPISEPKEDTSPDLKEGLSQPMPEVAVVSSLDTRSDSEAAAKLANLKDKGPARSTSHEKKSNKQLKKVSSGDVQENSMVDGARQSATVSAPSSKFSHEGLDSRDLDAKESTRPGAVSEKPSVSMDADTEGISSATSRNQQESERSDVSSPAVTRSSLEGNIVLDMALEGSRRTLPIEEDHPPKTSAETKELAAIGNGNGSSSNGKDKKENAVTPD